MKKLGKKLQHQQETVEAYACGCVCVCYAPCWCSSCQPYNSSEYGSTNYRNCSSLSSGSNSSSNYNVMSSYY